jgi:DNA-binding PadR family transcriptional regulator
MRHKGESLGLKRGSLYHAVLTLARSGLIEAAETIRDGRRPERTVYRLTESGEAQLLAWLRELLSRPLSESSHFMTALAHVHQLTPHEVEEQLMVRQVFLEAALGSLDALVRTVGSMVGRTSALELEYSRAVARAELDWVRGLADELRSGRLAWDVEELRRRFGSEEKGR